MRVAVSARRCARAASRSSASPRRAPAHARQRSASGSEFARLQDPCARGCPRARPRGGLRRDARSLLGWTSGFAGTPGSGTSTTCSASGSTRFASRNAWLRRPASAICGVSAVRAHARRRTAAVPMLAPLYRDIQVLQLHRLRSITMGG